MFTLEIRTSGAAFDEENLAKEVARLLVDVAANVIFDGNDSKTHSIIDINGNRCGSWKLSAE